MISNVTCATFGADVSKNFGAHTFISAFIAFMLLKCGLDCFFTSITVCLFVSIFVF